MDEKVLGFEEKLQQLLAEAKRKKNVLEEFRTSFPETIWTGKNGTQSLTFWMQIR